MHRAEKGAKAAATIPFSVRLIQRYDWHSPKMPAWLSPQGTDRRISIFWTWLWVKNENMAELPTFVNTKYLHSQHQIPAHILNQKCRCPWDFKVKHLYAYGPAQRQAALYQGFSGLWRQQGDRVSFTGSGPASGRKINSIPAEIKTQAENKPSPVNEVLIITALELKNLYINKMANLFHTKKERASSI